MSTTFHAEITLNADGTYHRPGGPTLNVSNHNAVLVLERLGIPVDPSDLFGEIDPEDLLGRALVANVGRDDDGTDATADGNITYCGTRPGYFEDRMAELTEVARHAKACGVQVVWA